MIDAQISRLSQLWFDALAGICAHVRRGGGGLTPSDIAPARLSQQQIDELCRQDRIADMLPLTPLQQGLLFHANTTQGNDDDLYAVQLDITMTGPLDPDRLREAVHTVVTRHPNLAARFCRQFDEPVQIIPADPVPAWQYLELRWHRCDRSDPAAVRRRTRRGLRPRRPAGLPGRVDPHRRDRHRLVLTNHHIVLDGWSLPILLQEIFAAYYGQRLPAADVVSPVCQLAGRTRPRCRPSGLARGARRLRHSYLGGTDRTGRRWGGEACDVSGAAEQTTRALSELARSHHTTVNTVLQAGWAQLLMWLTGQHDVAFGTAVSGRPTEMAGAESMVGLLINTVPVRANITPATTTAELLDQLQHAHNDTLEHQHLALTEIHRVDRPRPTVRHAVRVRELPGRHGHAL